MSSAIGGASTADTLVQLIVAMAGSGVMVAAVQGLFTRRRTRAEIGATGANTTKVLTDAAAVIVANLQADNAALRVELSALRAEVTMLSRWRAAAERNFAAHERWDEKIAQAIQSCSEFRGRPDQWVSPPPPLRPVTGEIPTVERT